MLTFCIFFFFFFFNDTATTEIYTLSLHDALPIWRHTLSTKPSRTVSPYSRRSPTLPRVTICCPRLVPSFGRDRKSTRLNSSHANISYAVFCLKKKKKTHKTTEYNITKSTNNGRVA